jgi:glycosyltransferase involved in cell wall biosynthesis
VAEARGHRIAVVNWTGRRAAGIETYVEFLLEALTDCGHDVALWAETDEPAGRTPLTVPEGRVRWCAAVDGLEASMAALRGWSPRLLIVNGMVDHALEARLIGLGPSVFIAHTYTGTCISGSKTHLFPRGTPCGRVFGPACLALFYPRRCGGVNPWTMAKDYRRQRERLDVIRSYSRVLTLSEHMRREYLRHGLPPSRVRALPQYWPLPAASAAPPPAAGATLLFLGRIDPLKGCHLLIEALPLLRSRVQAPVRLIVAGDGPDRNRCEVLAARARSNDVAIDFVGWVDAAGRERVLREATVFVMPSVWPEPYGLSGLEAVTAGLPVAAFDVGGIPEWLTHEVGRLAPASPPTAAGLAHAIAGCLGMGRRPGPASTADRRKRHVDALAVEIEDAVAG